MPSDITVRLDAIEAKIDATYAAAERTRRYLFWTGVVTVALIILPAVGLVFAIPQFLSSYSDLLKI